MKKFLTGVAFTLAAIATFTSCKKDGLDPRPDTEEVPLILPRPSSNPQRRFLDAATARANTATLAGRQRPVFEFTLELDNSRDLKIDTVIVYKSFRSGTATLSYGQRMVVGRYAASAFPIAFSQNSDEIITGLRFLSGTNLLPLKTPPSTASPDPTNNNIIAGSSAIVFTFEYKLTDGRLIILTPVTTVTYTGGNGLPGGTFQRISGTLANAPYAAVAEFK